MRIAAVSDVHYPRFFNRFEKALESFHGDVDLFIMAGDMVCRGRVEDYGVVLDVLKGVFGKCRLIGIFGNEEYEERVDRLRDLYPEVVWLDDEELVIGNTCFVGTRGSLQEPTPWQFRNVAGIRERYRRRELAIAKMLEAAMRRGLRTVLVSHYAPTYITLDGEKPSIWKYLGSKRMERLITKVGVDVVIHGHAHGSRRTEGVINSTRVYNVALPATGKITLIDLEVKRGLLEYI